MNKILKQILFWSPRILGILFALFLSLFSLDIFGVGLSPREIVIGLLMHNIPVFVLAIALILAWKREWVGAVLFIGWAVWYITFMRGFDWIAYAIISGLPALIGLLFLAGWVWRKDIRGE